MAENPEITITTLNGRYKVHYDGLLMFSFNQLDYKGCYFYKDDHLLYGMDIYLMNDLGGSTTMTIHFKTKETWLLVNKVMDLI